MIYGVYVVVIDRVNVVVKTQEPLLKSLLKSLLKWKTSRSRIIPWPRM
jgi:hypothetical protein